MNCAGEIDWSLHQETFLCPLLTAVLKPFHRDFSDNWLKWMPESPPQVTVKRGVGNLIELYWAKCFKENRFMTITLLWPTGLDTLNNYLLHNYGPLWWGVGRGSGWTWSTHGTNEKCIQHEDKRPARWPRHELEYNIKRCPTEIKYEVVNRIHPLQDRVQT